jgi:hypothetical protein
MGTRTFFAKKYVSPSPQKVRVPFASEISRDGGPPKAVEGKAVIASEARQSSAEHEPDPAAGLLRSARNDERSGLQVDACSAEEGRALLEATDNPVGVLFDPEALVARWRGGEGEEALLVQPAGEPSAIPAAHGMT